MPEIADDLDIEQIIAAARPAQVEERLCLDGTLNAEHDRLTRALAEAEDAERFDGERSLGEAPASLGLARQVREVEELMRAAAVTFRLQALPSDEFAALKAKHTKGGDTLDTPAFLTALVAASLVSPKATLDQAKRLIDKTLSEAQAERLRLAAWRVNTGVVDIPFSRAASVILGTRDSSRS